MYARMQQLSTAARIQLTINREWPVGAQGRYNVEAAVVAQSAAPLREKRARRSVRTRADGFSALRALAGSGRLLR